MKPKKKICCICGKEFAEWGNNPDPVKDLDGKLFDPEAQCCDNCNATIVVPYRVAIAYGRKDRMELLELHIRSLEVQRDVDKRKTTKNKN